MQNLIEILPELNNGWQLRENGGFYRIAENGEFEMYFLPHDECAQGDMFQMEMGFFSKTAFKNPERLKRIFRWYMAEFKIDLPVAYEERADGWHIFVTYDNGFDFFYAVIMATGSEDVSK